MHPTPCPTATLIAASHRPLTEAEKVFIAARGSELGMLLARLFPPVPEAATPTPVVPSSPTARGVASGIVRGAAR